MSSKPEVGQLYVLRDDFDPNVRGVTNHIFLVFDYSEGPHPYDTYSKIVCLYSNFSSFSWDDKDYFKPRDTSIIGKLHEMDRLHELPNLIKDLLEEKHIAVLNKYNLNSHVLLYSMRYSDRLYPIPSPSVFPKKMEKWLPYIFAPHHPVVFAPPSPTLFL